MDTLVVAGLTVVLVAVKATVLLGAGWGAASSLPRLSASARHLAAFLALLGAAALPLLSPLVPDWEWRVLPAAPATAAVRASGVPGRPEKQKSLDASSRAGAARPSEKSAAFPSLVERMGPAGVTLLAADAPAPRALAWRDLLAAVAVAWALGAAAMLARLGAGLLAVRRLVRGASPLDDPAWRRDADDAARALSLPRPAALLSSDETEVPLTAGVLRPVLVLPRAARAWGAERRRVVLLHELAHVRRRDTLARLAAEVVAALYWFHPLAHAAVRRLLRDGERAADDLVLTAGTRPSDYAAQLVAIVKSLTAPPERWALAMARPSQVEERVRAILDPAARRVPVGGARAAVWAVGLVLLTAPLSALRLGRAEAAPPKGGVVLAAPKRESGASWYSKGMDAHGDERYDEAIAAFKKAIDLGYREGASAYNVACGYALKGDRDQAFAWLKKASSFGFDVAGYLGDSDLDALHGDPRWKDLKEAARAARKDLRSREGEAAEKRLDALLAGGTKDGPTLYRTGVDLLNAERWDAAEKAFRASAAAGNRPGTSYYNAACALARAGKKAEALATLRQAVANGYTDARHMEDDDDLDSLHGEKGFTEIVDLASDLTLSGGDGMFFGNLLPRTQRSAWRGELPRYERVAKAHPDMGIAWFNLGYAQLMADRPEAAVGSLEKSLQLGYRKPTTLYNLACAEARSGNTDKAFERLFASIDAGFDAAGQMRSDPDLDSLRKDPRFSQAVAKAKARAHDEEEED